MTSTQGIELVSLRKELRVVQPSTALHGDPLGQRIIFKCITVIDRPIHHARPRTSLPGRAIRGERKHKRKRRSRELEARGHLPAFITAPVVYGVFCIRFAGIFQGRRLFLALLADSLLSRQSFGAPPFPPLLWVINRIYRIYERLPLRGARLGSAC